MAKYRKVLVLGDTTTHGGRIISAWGQTIDVTIDGKHVVCKGDKVICPRCKGIHTIIQGADGHDGPRMMINGRPAAREGDRVSDGSILLSIGQSIATYETEGEVHRAVATGGAGATSRTATTAARGTSFAQQESGEQEAPDEIPEIRIVPVTQIAGHLGIISYMERIDGAPLVKAESVTIGNSDIRTGWLRHDKKRLYFIPPDTVASTKYVCFDGGERLFFEKAVFATKRHGEMVDSIKEQMEVLEAFLQDFKSNGQEACNDALYNTLARYWQALEYLEQCNPDLSEQEYLLATLDKISKGGQA